MGGITNWPGRHVYLIGTNRLHNELLAYVITQGTKASCEIVASLDDVPTSDAKATQRLLLYDTTNVENILGRFGAFSAKEALQNDFLVLSNLPHISGMERTMLKLGVRGFIYEMDGIDTLLRMIDAVFNLELWVSRQIISELLISDKQFTSGVAEVGGTLTSREADILNGITKGFTNSKIAEIYLLSPHTVKTHIYHIFKKIDVRNRLQAAQWASRHNS